MTILVTSVLFRAYLRRLRRKMTSGSDSRSLCGPVDGRGANTPPSLSNIHALGAAKRFKCFLGPRACIHICIENTGRSVSTRNAFAGYVLIVPNRVGQVVCELHITEPRENRPKMHQDATRLQALESIRQHRQSAQWNFLAEVPVQDACVYTNTHSNIDSLIQTLPVFKTYTAA